MKNERRPKISLKERYSASLEKSKTISMEDLKNNKSKIKKIDWYINMEESGYEWWK